jgi:trans-aconitate 2-methyltransferase
MPDMPWDPAQYLRFADERTRPALDLLARIEKDAPRLVHDLGSGAGNVTRLLRLRWPEAFIIGVDSSDEMLARAREALPSVRFERADLATWRPARPADVIYSNAALHWIDDHASLFPNLVKGLAPGGVLAVQVPRNFDAPYHSEIVTAVRAGPWRSRLEPLVRHWPVGDPTFYFDLLAPLSESVDIWQTEYLHVLTGTDPVKEWTKGSALKPYLDALEEPERSRFEARYAELMGKAYPRRADGRTLFPFRRLFMIATRSA